MSSRTARRNNRKLTAEQQRDSDTDDDSWLPPSENALAKSLAQWARQGAYFHPGSISPETSSPANSTAGYVYPKPPPTSSTERSGSVYSRSVSYAGSYDTGSDFKLPAKPRDRSASIQSNSSIVDGLLFEIYDQWHYRPHRDSLDSDTFTECSSTSEVFFGRGDTCHLVFEQRTARRYHKALLLEKGKEELIDI